MEHSFIQHFIPEARYYDMLIYIGIGIFIIGAIIRALVSVQSTWELKRRIMTVMQHNELTTRFRSHRRLGLILETVGLLFLLIPIIKEMI